MITFISGGVRSGKSSFAESYIIDRAPTNKVYVATAMIYDDEMKKRVKRHQKSRLGKGWKTYEQQTSISELEFTEYDVVLLDCLTNLVANEMFQSNLRGIELITKVVDDLKVVAKNVKELVIVSNDIFSSIDDYSMETMDYVKSLGLIHCEITKIADVCYELNYSVPTKMKG